MYCPNVFKLPIYNKSPNEIYNSFVKAKENRITELIATGMDRDYADYVYSLSKSNKLEIDNYIIGFLYVDYRSSCFEYRLAICKRKNSNKTYKMPLFTETKHYMGMAQHINGIYTPPDETNNEETARLLLEDITLICNSYLDGAYCDLESFKLINNSIDYIKLISLLENNS